VSVPLLRVEDVRRHFGSLEVLRGVSFTATAGDAIALVGPSGCGKSTLLACLGALDRPDGGRVEVAGSDLASLSVDGLARLRNRKVGFVFQDHRLLPQYTVLENVLLPAFAPGAEQGPEVEARAAELLSRVGLGERLDHRPAELSGGEAQRVAVARALIQRPPLLLCDEPTGNLDPATARSVAELLFELHTAHHNILIVVTHSLELAARFGRRCELRDGRVVEG
jgi:predicted ABC-type transport system involved in lysophospholipase L1 biosynthesis ATPase subunit